MNGNSLINLSFGDRKEKNKKGIPLTTPMKFQSEISKPLSPSKDAGTSPFSQRTPGIVWVHFNLRAIVKFCFQY